MSTLLQSRYERQLMLTEIGSSGQARLAAARVLIVGVGGLGSPIALYLAAAGVGHLTLVDADVVSLHNLQRQVLYAEPDLGLPKVCCAQKRLQQLNSEVSITALPHRLTPENAEELISGHDVVVDGCDNHATRYLMDEVCGRLGVPYVYGAISCFTGQVSVFHHPVFPFSYTQLFPASDALSAQPPARGGVLGVTPGVIGTVQAAEVLKIITRCGEVLCGKLWCIDLRTMQTQLINL